MKIIRTSLFERALKKLGASDAELTALEDEIASNPEAGDVIPGLKGVRKIRFAMRGKGKSGGGRAVYIVLWTDDAAYMLLAYSKSDQTDLSPAQRKAVLVMLEELDDG